MAPVTSLALRACSCSCAWFYGHLLAVACSWSNSMPAARRIRIAVCISSPSLDSPRHSVFSASNFPIQCQFASASINRPQRFLAQLPHFSLVLHHERQHPIVGPGTGDLEWSPDGSLAGIVPSAHPACHRQTTSGTGGNRQANDKKELMFLP